MEYLQKCSLLDENRDEISFAADKDKIPPNFGKPRRELACYRRSGKPPLSDAPDIKGGFILQSGGVEINNTFQALLEMQRDELEPEVASLLFGER